MPVSRDFKVGLFIVCTAAILFLSLAYLAVGKGFFENVHTFTLSSKSGDGFTEGMPVVFSGFNIGKVHALELNEKGVVLIKIKIPHRHLQWIKSDSEFILYRPLIGSARIVVNSENLASPTLDENMIPEVMLINDINDAIARIEPVLERIIQIAENVEQLTRALSDPKGDFNRTLANAEKITANLAGKKSLLEMAVSDEASVKSVHEALKKMQDITVRLDDLLKKTDEQLYHQEGTLPQVNAILKDLLGKLQRLDKTIDNINQISTDTSEGMKDFRILRSDIDDVVNAIDGVVKKIDGIVGSKKDPEFKVP
jgi:phospholipid/cholesterol/gamma-HCH transport system substrate-binding protein